MCVCVCVCCVCVCVVYSCVFTSLRQFSVSFALLSLGWVRLVRLGQFSIVYPCVLCVCVVCCVSVCVYVCMCVCVCVCV